MSKVHLPSLNGVRAIAVLMVVFSHVDQFCDLLYIKSLGIGGLGLGWKGVVLFFTLSGFLITYLLEIEKNTFNRIDIKKFYIRRILRIWPLYYLIILVTILLSLFSIDVIQFSNAQLTSLVNFFLLIGNYEYVFGVGIITLTPLWSVAVEEQFYIFWPWIVSNYKKTIISVIIFLFCFLFFKFLVQKLDPHWYKLIYISSFSCMAIGALMALLTFRFNKLRQIFFNKYFQFFILVLFILLHFTSIFHFYTFIQREVYALVDGLVILNLAFNKKSVFKLENYLLNKIGIVSYGIYIYHMLIILFIGKLTGYLNLNFVQFGLLGSFILALLVLLISIIVSIFSYNFFEKKFLLLKEKFSIVKSSV